MSRPTLHEVDGRGCVRFLAEQRGAARRGAQYERAFNLVIVIVAALAFVATFMLALY